MKKTLIIALLLMCSYTYADQATLEAAKRLLTVTPMEPMVEDMANKMAAQLPEKNRAMFVQVMTKEVDINKLESAAIDAMVKTFTAEELNAYSNFYSSEVGKSAVSKFGKYMSLLTPELQKEMVRAMQSLERAK